MLVLVQGHRRRYLDRGEHPVVEPGFDLLQGADQLGVAHDETDPPSGHVVALGEGEALHRHILGPLHLEDRGGLVPVIGDVGIGDVTDDIETLPPGDLHQPLVEVQSYRGGGGVVGEIDHQKLGLGDRVAQGMFQIGKETLLIDLESALIEGQLHLLHIASR